MQESFTVPLILAPNNLIYRISVSVFSTLPEDEALLTRICPENYFLHFSNPFVYKYLTNLQSQMRFLVVIYI